MASGVIAPISTSKGAGLDVDEHQFTYPGEGEAQVRGAHLLTRGWLLRCDVCGRLSRACVCVCVCVCVCLFVCA